MSLTAARLRNSLVGRWRKYLGRPLGRAAQLATRRARISRYLASHGAPALILGAGPQRRDGWLASDLQPRNGSVVYIDACRPLPFPDGSLAFVFAEHMVEHIAYEQGAGLALEVLRVLRPGGVFRIATPDLQAIARLVLPPLDPAALRYVQAFNRVFGRPDDSAAVVANRALRWWGHQFVYDETTLRDLLERAGFATIERKAVGQSFHAMLQDLEGHGDVIGQEMNRYETMVLEATKR
jgi:predicted SAM-dependent methyltransferase